MRVGGGGGGGVQMGGPETNEDKTQFSAKLNTFSALFRKSIVFVKGLGNAVSFCSLPYDV